MTPIALLNNFVDGRAWPRVVGYPSLIRPWYAGDWAYATDGRIAARIPRKSVKLRISKREYLYPNIEALFEASWRGTVWEPWPETWERVVRSELRGQDFVPMERKIGGRLIHGYYQQLLASIGGIEYAVSAIAPDPQSPLPLRGPFGLQGLLMPMLPYLER